MGDTLFLHEVKGADIRLIIGGGFGILTQSWRLWWEWSGTRPLNSAINRVANHMLQRPDALSLSTFQLLTVWV